MAIRPNCANSAWARERRPGCTASCTSTGWNGTAFFLPCEQELEHGPRDFFANPAATDPRCIVKLAVEDGFNGIVTQIGLAEKFYWDYAGEVPLVLKLNGKTDIPSDERAPTRTGSGCR